MTALLTIAEAAAALHISTCTLRRRVARGEVPHTRLFGDGPIRFTQEQIREIVEGGEKPILAKEERRPVTRGYVCKWV